MLYLFLAPRRGHGTSKTIEILRAVCKFCGFAILGSSRLKKSIWDVLGPQLGDLWAPVWTLRAPKAPARGLQDHPRRLQDGCDGLHNRPKAPQGPFRETSKSPRPSKKRPGGALWPPRCRNLSWKSSSSGREPYYFLGGPGGLQERSKRPPEALLDAFRKPRGSKSPP